MTSDNKTTAGMTGSRKTFRFCALHFHWWEISLCFQHKQSWAVRFPHSEEKKKVNMKKSSFFTTDVTDDMRVGSKWDILINFFLKMC